MNTCLTLFTVYIKIKSNYISVIALYKIASILFLQPLKFTLAGTCSLISAAIGVELISYCNFKFAGIP